MRTLLGTLCFLIATCSPTLAADTKKEPSEKQLAQQQKMKDCNAKAGSMKGDERQKFMANCLSAKPGVTAPQTKQQEKMTACNKNASAKNLKGKDRQNFMSSCLKG